MKKLMENKVVFGSVIAGGAAIVAIIVLSVLLAMNACSQEVASDVVEEEAAVEDVIIEEDVVVEEEIVSDEEFDDEEIVEEDEGEEEDAGEIEMIDAPNIIEEAEIVEQIIVSGEVRFEFDANGIKWVYNTGDLDYEDGYTRYNRPNGTVNEETGMVWLFDANKVRWVTPEFYQRYLDDIELNEQPPLTL